MIIGIPKELKVAEKRVSITPAGVQALVQQGHKVLVEAGAGLGSCLPNESYAQAGAEIRSSANEVWDDSEMILKVKEPVTPEFDLMHEGQVLFTYLHLAANKNLTQKLVEKRIIGIAYETVQTDEGCLPLLTPMSAIAGRLSIQMGAYSLETQNGGMGILLSGVPGVRPARLVILGGGIVGFNACQIATGIGAQVSILDINQQRLTYIDEVMRVSNVITLMSNQTNLEEEVTSADLVIGAVLIPGARAPKLISRELVKRMKQGAAIVDVAVDQGGCCETTCPTTHENPTYVEEGVVHYCVTNMPGVVPHTSTFALTNATLPYALEVANKGYEKAMQQNPEIARGMNVIKGDLVHKVVAESLGMSCRPIC